MIENVFIKYREQRNDRDRDKHAGNSRNLLAGQHRKNYRQRMQMNAFADDSRIENVILGDTQSSEENTRP